MTFKRRATKLGIYRPNQGRRGIKRNESEFYSITIPLKDIISWKFKGHYTSSRLRKRLIKEGYKKNKCEECNIDEWRGKKITCELHHIDGNRGNNKLENLEIIPQKENQKHAYINGLSPTKKILIKDITTNTIYEFHGDYWHGNPKKYSCDTINEMTKTTMGELYAKTLERDDRIRELGYNLIIMWESDWKQIKSAF
jgi:hypothetical protein